MGKINVYIQDPETIRSLNWKNPPEHPSQYLQPQRKTLGPEECCEWRQYVNRPLRGWVLSPPSRWEHFEFFICQVWTCLHARKWLDSGPRARPRPSSLVLIHHLGDIGASELSKGSQRPMSIWKSLDAFNSSSLPSKEHSH